MSNVTERGFRINKFIDGNGIECSLQESSEARDEGLIWFGCNDIGLKKFVPHQGWSDVPLMNDKHTGITHIANTRMHLTQSQVTELLPALQYFAEHGYLPNDEKDTK